MTSPSWIDLGYCHALAWLGKAGLAMLLLALSPTAGADDQTPARPAHIVLIVADDLGWNDVGFHGSEIATPHLDRLANEGIELDRFYVQPTCSPTRAALMTGKSPARLGILRPIAKNDPGGLPFEGRLLPEILERAGYQTLMTGKWHLGHVERRYFPHRRGFERFYGHVTGGIGYWDHNHGGGHDWQRDGVTVREPGYATRLITDEAIARLADRDRDRPTFLYVAYNAPHLPNEAPEASIERYAHIENEFRRVHAAMVSEMDAQIGRLLAALEAEGMRDDTLVWFTSDNGGLNREAQPPALVSALETLADWFGEPLPLQALEFLRVNTLEGGASNLPLRGGKMSVYEGGTRVPALIHWPGRVGRGRSERFVTAQDVLPTLLEAIGREDSIPEDLDGVGRWGALARDEVDRDLPAYLTVGLDGSALHRWPWKLVLRSSPLPFATPEAELYRISDDPLEENDRSAERPEIVARLSAIAAHWPRGSGVHGSFWNVVRDPDRFGGPEDREPWAEAAR